ncbi:MAG: putative ral secretion pathway protein [Pseudomonadota bacterium]|jgi:general secretion pathway protein I
MTHEQRSTVDSVRTRAGMGRRLGAFTLLEVMVAVAILGLGLTTILTAQTGLFSSTKRAGQLSRAVGLARCKMSEIEVQLLKEGYQLTTDNEEGECCEDEASELRCRWTIAPVMLPELGAGMGSGADAGAGESESEGESTSMDSVGSNFGQAQDSLMGGDTAGAMQAMGSSGLASMAMSLVYPQLKGMLEASIRKVTVQVYWKDGATEKDLKVTQYLTNPQAGGLLAVDEGAGGAGAGGAGGAAPPRLNN